MSVVVYIHGKGGNAAEAEHYKALFPDRDVLGMEYVSDTPWDARKEFCDYFDELIKDERDIWLVANSIGAYYSMCSLAGYPIAKAFFISPIVDMEKLIIDMCGWAKVTEEELMERGTIETAWGECLSFEYLTWVRRNPVGWDIVTDVLYGSKDNLQSMETIKVFAERIGAKLTVMEGGEHWFHTKEQLEFIDRWIKNIITDNTALI